LVLIFLAVKEFRVTLFALHILQGLNVVFFNFFLEHRFTRIFIAIYVDLVIIESFFF
jgi:hypothetical protein